MRFKGTKKGEKNQGILMNSLYIFGIIVIIVIFLVLGYFYIKLQGDTLDELNCPSEGEEAYLGVILDLTDPLNPQQSERLKGKLNLFFDDAKVGTLISVGVVHTDKILQGSQISICKIATGEDANRLYENPKLLKVRYTEKFEIPLTKAIQSMIEAEEQPKSPIIESITSLVANTVGVRDKVYPKTLILVSDLVQNSEIISFFKGEVWRDFSQTSEYNNISGILNGFDVHIIRIPPPQSTSFNIKHVDDFWVRYLEAQKVNSIRLDKSTLGEI